MDASFALAYWISLLAIFGFFALVGMFCIGAILTALHFGKRNARVLGAVLGTVLGFALIEALPLFS